MPATFHLHVSIAQTTSSCLLGAKTASRVGNCTSSGPAMPASAAGSFTCHTPLDSPTDGGSRNRPLPSYLPCKKIPYNKNPNARQTLGGVEHLWTAVLAC